MDLEKAINMHNLQDLYQVLIDFKGFLMCSTDIWIV